MFITPQVEFKFRFTPTESFIENIERADKKFIIIAEFITASTIVHEPSSKSSLIVDISIDPQLDLSK